MKHKEQKMKREIETLSSSKESLESKINEFENLIEKKEHVLRRETDEKHGIRQEMINLQEDFIRVTEMMRNTSIKQIEFDQKEMNRILETENEKLKQEIEKLGELNLTLEKRLWSAKEKEECLALQICSLNQKSAETEKLLRNYTAMEKVVHERNESDLMELNFEGFPNADICDTSRKESGPFEDRRNQLGQTDNPSLRFPRKRTNMGVIIDHTHKVSFPDVNQDKELNFQSLPKLEESQSLMYPHISTILKSRNKEVTIDSVYSEFVYVCSDKIKVLRFLVLEKGTVFLYRNNHSVKCESEFPIQSITSIVVSKEFPHVLEVTFQKEKDKVESVVIENYSNGHFFEFLGMNYDFDFTCKRVGNIQSVDSSQFRNALCCMYKTVKRAGFLEQTQPNNSWGSWQVVFVIRLENVITIFQVPEKFYYDKFDAYRKTIQLIRLENYNVFANGSKIGYKKENTFYLKIRNENRDLIFSSGSEKSKDEWIQNLST